jgi:hypothetical protein
MNTNNDYFSRVLKQTLKKYAMKVMRLKIKDSKTKGLNSLAYIKREIEIIKSVKHVRPS